MTNNSYAVDWTGPSTVQDVQGRPDHVKQNRDVNLNQFSYRKQNWDLFFLIPRRVKTPIPLLYHVVQDHVKFDSSRKAADAGCPLVLKRYFLRYVGLLVMHLLNLFPL